MKIAQYYSIENMHLPLSTRLGALHASRKLANECLQMFLAALLHDLQVKCVDACNSLQTMTIATCQHTET